MIRYIYLQPRSSNRPQPRNLSRILSNEELHRDTSCFYHTCFTRIKADLLTSGVKPKQCLKCDTLHIDVVPSNIVKDQLDQLTAVRNEEENFSSGSSIVNELINSSHNFQRGSSVRVFAYTSRSSITSFFGSRER